MVVSGETRLASLTAGARKAIRSVNYGCDVGCEISTTDVFPIRQYYVAVISA